MHTHVHAHLHTPMYTHINVSYTYTPYTEREVGAVFGGKAHRNRTQCHVSLQPVLRVQKNVDDPYGADKVGEVLRSVQSYQSLGSH